MCSLLILPPGPRHWHSARGQAGRENRLVTGQPTEVCFLSSSGQADSFCAAGEPSLLPFPSFPAASKCRTQHISMFLMPVSPRKSFITRWSETVSLSPWHRMVSTNHGVLPSALGVPCFISNQPSVQLIKGLWCSKDHFPLITKHFSDQVHSPKSYALHLASQLAGSPLYSRAS